MELVGDIPSWIYRKYKKFKKPEKVCPLFLLVGGGVILFKVTFNIPHGARVAGNTPQGFCLPLPGGILPKMGETWIVDTAQRISAYSLYVRLIRRWRGLLMDYEDTQKGQPDFRKGVLLFHDGVSFPLSETIYATAWEDYQVLSANPNAVIIREGMVIRWRKKGKPPEELPLYRFSTKYKRQPLLGAREEIEDFLNSLELLVEQVVEESRKKRSGSVLKTGSAAEERGVATSSL